MRKTLILLIATLLMVSFVGCGNNNSLEKRIEDNQKSIEQAEKVQQDAQERLDRINELKAEYDALQEKISRLEKGTNEYKKAIEENNRLVRQIIKEFPEIEPYVSEK